MKVSLVRSTIQAVQTSLFLRRSLSSMTASNIKGYAFGFMANKQMPLPSPSVSSGRVIASQKIAKTNYEENMQDFESAFVYEFPTLQDAMDWHDKGQDNAESDYEQGPVVVSEGEQFGEAFGGFSLFLIKVEDKEKFKAYNPGESLSRYMSKKISVPLSKAAASTGTNGFDAAVLIAFPTAKDGEKWLVSDEYKPQGELRFATTSGHGVVISTVN